MYFDADPDHDSDPGFFNGILSFRDSGKEYCVNSVSNDYNS